VTSKKDIEDEQQQWEGLLNLLAEWIARNWIEENKLSSTTQK